MENEKERKKVSIKYAIDEYKLERKKKIFLLGALMAAGVGAAVIGDTLGISSTEIMTYVETALSMGVVINAGSLHSVNKKLKKLKEEEKSLDNNSLNM